MDDEILALMRKLAQEGEQFPGIVFDADDPPRCFFCYLEQENLNFRAPQHRADCPMVRARVLLGIVE